MSVPLDPDADQILRRLRQERVTALYHFTSVENLRSIREMNGLCPKDVLENAGYWPCPEPGGNETSHSLDRRKGNWDKLSVNFTPHTPMAYHKKRASHLCFFVLRRVVATYAGVLFTDKNAASTQSQRRAKGLPGLDLVNFDAIRSYARPWDKEGWVGPVQAEVLIPHKVPLKDIREVAFVSDASLREGERLWGSDPLRPPFMVKPYYFDDSSRSGDLVLNFSHLITLGMTNEVINQSTVDSIHRYRSTFRRQSNGHVTALAKVYALTGAQGRAIWNPGGIFRVYEFESSSEYWHWPSIPMDQLPDGICSVEYRINEIRWATKSVFKKLVLGQQLQLTWGHETPQTIPN